MYKIQNKQPKSFSLYSPVGGLVVHGGAYRDKPTNMLGVKMAVEIDLPCTIDVPTEDFNVPEVDDLYIGVLKTFLLLRKKESVYVGCWGGIGRTGLFLACLTKAAHEEFGEDPIRYVRRVYNPKAVETTAQMAMVGAFPSDKVARWAFGSLWKLRLYIWGWETRKRLFK